MKKLLVILILLVGAGVLVMTCPSEKEHQQAITSALNSYAQDEISQKNDNVVVGLVANALFGTLSDVAIDRMLTVDNYFVVSIGRINWDGESHVVSVGVLGHVFTFDKEDISQAIASRQK